MPYYRQQGEIAPKRSTELRSGDGALRYEELVSSVGFAGASSFLYRLRPSTRVSEITPLPAGGVIPGPSIVTNHCIGVDRLEDPDGPFDRTTLVHNEDFAYSVGSPPRTDDFCRNAGADELWVVVRGTGVLETEFGDLAYGPLDLVVIPRGTTWRARPADPDQHLVCIETATPLTPPPAYRNPAGQFTSRSLYTERDIRGPVLREPVDAHGAFGVVIKLGDDYVRAVLPTHPFDVVGWDGALYPYALGMRSLEPLSGRVHLTPDFHEVLRSNGLVVCAITPGRTPDHPQSTRAQPDHRADCDEVFYRFASDGNAVATGTITVHGRALAHGPKPGFEDRPLPERSEVWGIIIDAGRPLRLTAAAVAASDPDYPRAWL